MIAAVIKKNLWNSLAICPHLKQLNQLPPPRNLWQVQFSRFHQFSNTPNSGKQTKVRLHSNHLFQPNLRSWYWVCRFDDVNCIWYVCMNMPIGTANLWNFSKLNARFPEDAKVAKRRQQSLSANAISKMPSCCRTCSFPCAMFTPSAGLHTCPLLWHYMHS